MNDTATLITDLSSAFNRRDWPQTLQLANRLLPSMPKHPLLRYIAGVAEMEHGNMPMALTHLHIATELEPRRADFAVQFAKALTEVKMIREARAAADKAMALAPKDPVALDTLGVIYTQAHAHTDAVKAYRGATTIAPTIVHYHYNLAIALIAVGDLGDAEAELEACLQIDPRCWKAHFTLSQLHKQAPNHNHIARMKGLLDAGNGELAGC